MATLGTGVNEALFYPNHPSELQILAFRPLPIVASVQNAQRELRPVGYFAYMNLFWGVAYPLEKLRTKLFVLFVTGDALLYNALMIRFIYPIFVVEHGEDYRLAGNDKGESAFTFYFLSIVGCVLIWVSECFFVRRAYLLMRRNRVYLVFAVALPSTVAVLGVLSLPSQYRFTDGKPISERGTFLIQLAFWLKAADEIILTSVLGWCFHRNRDSEFKTRNWSIFMRIFHAAIATSSVSTGFLLSSALAQLSGTNTSLSFALTYQVGPVMGASVLYS
ncbi:hypothetical protein BT69DRAFT_1353089 [Atractiella rhizophila]|nr:hypothetical protein BT69DRAFT_1353089 [Atractiella rhizophila]